MEYFLGAAITMMAYIATNKFLKPKLSEQKISKVVYNQSYIYSLMRPYLDEVGPLENELPRQSKEYLKNAYLKIMVINNKAYWIKDNAFYVADIVDGEVNKENARKVDTMSINKLELDEMIFIVEKLREEDDDNRSAG